MYKLFNEEEYYGAIEYKAFIHFPFAEKKLRFTSQINFRLIEGNGKAIYLVGVNDYGFLFCNKLKLLLISIYNLNKLLNNLNINYTCKLCTKHNYVFAIYIIKKTINNDLLDDIL
tara:strand:+ start:17464 stop:17808 length:345 start_codon:yes stop_codon:yes gene_type:complete